MAIAFDALEVTQTKESLAKIEDDVRSDLSLRSRFQKKALLRALWLSSYYRTTDANMGDCINCWKFLSSALNFTTSLLVSLSTVVPSIAAFSVGLASIFLNRMPAFRTEERVDAVTLSEVRTFRLKSTP